MHFTIAKAILASLLAAFSFTGQQIGKQKEFDRQQLIAKQAAQEKKDEKLLEDAERGCFQEPHDCAMLHTYFPKLVPAPPEPTE